MDAVWDILVYHSDIIGGLGVLSITMFLFSILLLPALIIRLPEDFYIEKENKHPQLEPPKKFFRRLFLNSLGILLLIAGILMLFLPGQGLLTIAVAFIFLDFPRKKHLEYWVLNNTKILQVANWIRKRANCPPLRLK